MSEGLQQKVQAKRQKQAAPDMAEVESLGIAEAQEAIQAVKESAKPAEVPAEVPAAPKVVLEFPGGKILEGGVVVKDPEPVRTGPREVLAITRGENVTDAQWRGLQSQLIDMGVTFQMQAGK